jgi:hypothetical protein
MNALIRILAGLLFLALALMTVLDFRGTVSDAVQANIAWKHRLALHSKWFRPPPSEERKFRSTVLAARAAVSVIWFLSGGSLLTSGIISASR